uniref:Lactose permease n=1 Tax=Coccidioides posadasii RMSCC 3488 TaxID=454284 RepID=A0A0J6IK44_COCPO|nr:lactose permease [Coccidioides posadasii RMSCC 3488]
MADSQRSTEDVGDEKDVRPVHTTVVGGNTAYHTAMLKEPPNPRSWNSIALFAASLVGFLCSSMNGYDGSLYNSIAANEVFLRYFNGSNKGIWAGIVSSMYQIGSVAALPFVGPINDSFGRRIGMFTGALIVIVGTIVSATVTGGNVGQFMGGRFVLGFGVAITSSAGPMYVTEVSHPAYRGVMTGFSNTFWFIGSILSSGVARGTNHLGGHATWRIPLWFQLLFSGIISGCVLFVPESPRWLYVHNKRDHAKAMLVKYHGQGNPESEWVKLQLAEYDEYLDINGADKRWWDYRSLFNTPVSRYRIFCSCCVTIFSQWAGNSVLSYFMSAVLDSAGVSGTVPQLNVILINSCQQFIWSIIGASLVDRAGRRPLLLFANIGCSVVWLCICITSSEFANHGGTKNFPGTSPAAGTATLAFIFVFGAVFSIGFTPLQALYPVEVLSFEMRAKGLAFQNLALNAALLLNQFAWPVAMDKIGWHTYIIFCVWCAVQAVVIYYFIPETKNCTLEELDLIFNSSNPVKASVRKGRLGVDVFGGIIKVESEG